MNLFDQLVDEALKNRPELSSLRIAAEKEMCRFLSLEQIDKILNQEHLWPFIVSLMQNLAVKF